MIKVHRAQVCSDYLQIQTVRSSHLKNIIECVQLCECVRAWFSKQNLQINYIDKLVIES